MDRVKELLENVERESKVKEELFKVQSEQRRLVRENLPEYLDAGVIKVEINRTAINRILGRPRTKIMG